MALLPLVAESNDERPIYGPLGSQSGRALLSLHIICPLNTALDNGNGGEHKTMTAPYNISQRICKCIYNTTITTTITAFINAIAFGSAPNQAFKNRATGAPNATNVLFILAERDEDRPRANWPRFQPDH